MITVEISLVYLFAILSIALGAGAAAASWVAVVKLRALRERGLAVEARAVALRRELDRVALLAAQTQARVLNLEQAQVRNLARLQHIEQVHAKVADRIALVEFRGEGRSFDQAIDFARRGADPAKLAESFGLSRGEADLVTRLHGRATRA